MSETYDLFKKNICPDFLCGRELSDLSQEAIYELSDKQKNNLLYYLMQNAENESLIGSFVEDRSLINEYKKDRKYINTLWKKTCCYLDSDLHKNFPHQLHQHFWE